MSEAPAAPALSTHQDDTTFSYDKVKAVEKDRTHLNLPPSYDHDQLVQKINQYYSVDEIILSLKEQVDGHRKYNKITLQFPDELICDSATIVHELQRQLGATVESQPTATHQSCSGGSPCSNKTNDSCCKGVQAESSTSQKIYILADTSYSPCCVDEVAAEHVDSDLVIHFGDACLNPVDKLVTFYVFGKPTVDLDHLVAEFKARYPVGEDNKVMLMADSPHSHLLEGLYHSLKEEYPNLAYADLYLDTQSKVKVIGYQPTRSSHPLKVLNRIFSGLSDGDLDDTLSQYDLFHITVPKSPRLLQLTTRFGSVTVYDPKERKTSQGPFPNLMRRYRFMQMARTAGTIGLLVNTLSLSNTKNLINSMGKRIKDSGKKHYMFVVGKPNVAKLANFENVDMWCVLGCDHQGIILDQTNEYFKPIITPYELLLALSDDVTWTGKWETDFKKLLDQMVDEEANQEDEGNEDDEDDEDRPPEFNPVTGQYVSTSRPLRQLNHLRIAAEPEEEESETSLVKKFSSTIAIKNTVSTSAVHLQNRHWTGLGSDYNQDGLDEAGALVEEGRAGVARGYDYDREAHQ
ncbi:diphthamide biosynthesis protein [Suhomyces tanzawaensis NRRL Y-17324]|uniref:2-(3-amino-3-carboxypropyl)histidine synthase subunit 2 n=1 Tax=Suhomyces tanzawaensis NRRL Y-17324 TaxID=984487 RepID=A0A1E4SE43_9ASCO|nr:diphthamide biosynthesis protein [Suhomyces tanzawaensis NRRL Y-17324]ODV77736.1 diphthamide biosynthesis protein [Suhomyces tanzawaensis NRRL Y-17324]